MSNHHSTAARLKLASEYWPDIESGRKRQTVRRGYRRLRPGNRVVIREVGGEGTLTARIVSIAFKRLRDLDELDALRDGFGSVADLVYALECHYADLNDTEVISVIRFMDEERGQS